MQKVTATLDIWNWSIKGIVISQEENKDVLLIKEYVKTQGLRKGKILDIDMLTKSIHTVIENFQKKLWWEYIDEVIIGISHPDMIIERVLESKRILWGEIITRQDVDHLSHLINEISNKSNYEILKIIPVHWILDEDKVEKNPEWLEAKTLTLAADVFYIPKVYYQTINEIMDGLNLPVINIVPNILASVESLVDMDHQDLGTMVIDIGANQTSYAIYEEWYALGYGVVPVWGDEVTKDISIGMQIDIKEAEHIKTGKPDDEERINQTLNERFLEEIVTARYEQILEKIHTKLTHLDKDGRLAGGIYLTGQASHRYRAIDTSKQIFKLATFSGKDTSGSYGDIANNPMYHNCLWLYSRSKKYHNTKSLFSFRTMQWLGKWLWENITWFFKDLF